MKELVSRIEDEGVYLGGGIIKVDGFLNHQIDPHLMQTIGREFGQMFAAANPSRIMTSESSGIAPALATGMVLGVPVIYARKRTPLTMSGQVFRADAPSRTKGGFVSLMVSPDYLGPADRVLIIDDFLATGLTLLAMIDIVEQSGGAVVGIGCVIEKVFETGRSQVSHRYSGPIISLAKVNIIDGQLAVSD